MSRRIAILVAASPTSAFYSQVAVLKLALDQLPWSSWEHSVHLYLGGPPDEGALAAWRPHLQGVDIHWASNTSFDRDADWAQSDDVFRLAPADADVLLTMDADTLPVLPLEPVVEQVMASRAVAGVIAHYPPFPIIPVPPGPSCTETWQQIAKTLTDSSLDISYSHTLMGDTVTSGWRMTPFYLNFGVVFFPKSVFHAITAPYLTMRPRLMDQLPIPDFSGQVALTLAIASTGARTWALPMRYNFPNDPVAELMYPAELEQATIFHYLRTTAFDRHQIFTNQQQYDAFLGLSLQGVNQRFQTAVRRIVGEQYPFA